MDPLPAIATVIAALIGGFFGTWIAATVTAESTEKAAQIGAKSAKAVADATLRASERAWINEQSRPLIEAIIAAANRLSSDAHRQMTWLNENEPGDSPTPPAMSQAIDEILEPAQRLALVADPGVVEAASELYIASLNLDARRGFLAAPGRRDLSRDDIDAFLSESTVVDRRIDIVRNAYRKQLGQSSLNKPPSVLDREPPPSSPADV